MTHCSVTELMRGGLKNTERRFALKPNKLKDDYDRYCSESEREREREREREGGREGGEARKNMCQKMRLCCAQQKMQITCSGAKVRAVTEAT